jgi:siroheme synthase
MKLVFAGRAFTGIVREGAVKAPTIIIIGEVVRLRDQLKWFEPGV